MHIGDVFNVLDTTLTVMVSRRRWWWRPAAMLSAYGDDRSAAGSTTTKAAGRKSSRQPLRGRCFITPTGSSRGARRPNSLSCPL